MSHSLFFAPLLEAPIMTRRIPRTPSAFTLVELLVVIAIIGTLVALLIPAVQMARESSRRSLCTSNLHQLAIAVQRHEESFGTMPPGLPNCVDPSKFGIAGGAAGGAWCQGPNWAIALLPYLEEQVIFDQIKTCIDSSCNVCEECTMATVDSMNVNYLKQLMAPPTFLCPSAELIDSTYSFSNETTGPVARSVVINAMGGTIRTAISKGNYAANFGSDTYLSYKSPATAGAFDIVDVRGLRGSQVNQAQGDPSMKGTWKMGSKLGVKLSSVTDGSSTTILLSEVLGYPGAADNRGAWTFGGMGGSVFTTRLTPNSVPPDVVPSCQPIPMVAGYQFNCTMGTDPIPLAPPAGTFAAARSVHAGGGVVVVMVDGSTHYIAAEIDATVWQNLGTRRAGIVVEMPPD
jgi:prepilin-type N-terminal cleavage/methylation domain-containing protein